MGLVLLTFPISAPTPSAASTEQAPIEAHANAASGFSINLYEKGDFASQRTPFWCIGASMQMMLNIIGLTDDDSRAGQERYMRVARSMGPSLRQVDHGDSAGGLRGAGSSGWARGLVELGAGRYEERAVESYDAAIRTAAYTLRATGRPVGLIVWRGAHAWVMSGFKASADPLWNADFRVTGVYIQDPWYPRGGEGGGTRNWPASSCLSYRSIRSGVPPHSFGG
jgi:hypothetical protein